MGSGREENRNNTYPHAAGLAQPAGLIVAEEQKIIFFVDSESSAIRSIDLQNGQVSAVCGANRNPAVSLNIDDLISMTFCIKVYIHKYITGSA